MDIFVHYGPMCNFFKIDAQGCATFWTFLAILVFFIIVLPVFMLTAYILAQVCIFYWNFNIPPSFPFNKFILH